jgi:hypothetical protein
MQNLRCTRRSCCVGGGAGIEALIFIILSFSEPRQKGTVYRLRNNKLKLFNSGDEKEQRNCVGGSDLQLKFQQGRHKKHS